MYKIEAWLSFPQHSQNFCSQFVAMFAMLVDNWQKCFCRQFHDKTLSIPALMMNGESCRDRPGVRPRFSSFKEFIIQHASAIEEVTMRIRRMIDRDASCFEHHYLLIYEGFSSQSGL